MARRFPTRWLVGSFGATLLPFLIAAFAVTTGQFQPTVDQPIPDTQMYIVLLAGSQGIAVFWLAGLTKAVWSTSAPAEPARSPPRPE